MLSRLSVAVTLLATTLFALLLTFGAHEAQAATRVLLGYCTQTTSGCANDAEVKGDPSSDQGIPIEDGHGHAFDCNSFKRTTTSKIKVCACGHSCKGCPDERCKAPEQNQCATAAELGPFQAVCRVRVATSTLSPQHC